MLDEVDVVAIGFAIFFFVVVVSVAAEVFLFFVASLSPPNSAGGPSAFWEDASAAFRSF